MSTNENKYLVQFEGGGYDGCIWEYNFVVLLNPEIYDNPIMEVFISGYHGKTFLRMIKANPQKYYNDIKAIESDFNSGNVFIWQLENESELKDFCNTQNDLLVKGVLKFYDLELGIELYNTCPVCESLVTHFEMNPDNWQGCGGIMSSPDSWHCNECDSIYHCESCEEYDSTTQRREINDTEYYLCDICHETKQEEINDKLELELTNNIEDTAFFNGHVLSSWFNHYDTLAIDCIHCKARFTLDTDPNEITLCKGI